MFTLNIQRYLNKKKNLRISGGWKFLFIIYLFYFLFVTSIPLLLFLISNCITT